MISSRNLVSKLLFMLRKQCLLNQEGQTHKGKNVEGVVGKKSEGEGLKMAKMHCIPVWNCQRKISINRISVTYSMSNPCTEPNILCVISRALPMITHETEVKHCSL